MILVKLLGTGALQPLPGRALAAASISCEGHNLLLDCGEGTQTAARAAGLSLYKIDIIALTHFHGDHIFGLPGLLQSMGVANRREKVTIIGPVGLQEAMNPIMQLCVALPFAVELITLTDDSIPLHDICASWPKETSLRAFTTEHSVISMGYSFDYFRQGVFYPEKAAQLGIDKNLWKVLQHGSPVVQNGVTIMPEEVIGPPRKGIRVSYTGDTTLYAGLSDHVKNSDLLICEATYAEDDQQELARSRGHMTFNQAARAALDASANELWLTHYSPQISVPEDSLHYAADIFANTRCGFDGLEKMFTFEERHIGND